jgi:hypothetical protein
MSGADGDGTREAHRDRGSSNRDEANLRERRDVSYERK